MPRDGSDVYHLPPGSEGVPDTTVESAKYNALIADLELDLNNPRPITAGGTGATTSFDALIAMGGEMAGQTIVNYDAHAFKPGSFHSAVGATNAPTSGHAFVGFCYTTDDNNLFIEARDIDDTAVPQQMWVRRKKAGVWGAWATDVDPTKFVSIAGGTMTGPLVLSADATAALGAATKQQAEAAATAAGSSATSTAHSYTDSQISAEVTRANGAYQAKDAQLFAGIPINNSSNYTTVVTDAQKCIAGTGTITINSALYPVGTVITFAGYGGAMTITCSGNAMYWISPSGIVSGNRTLPDRGIATAIRTPDGNWIIGGNGLA